MRTDLPALRLRTAALLLLAPLVLGGCGPKTKAPQTATPAATEATVPGGVDLSPEALEALVAPIALYPDVVIGHVLLAATNPQEVLDAGNWLLEHADLSPAALDKQAADLGLSTSMRALLPFPETVDMMCREIDWTTDLGAAFNADQAAVLDAVQRMRKQAVEVGNLQTSEQLKVESTTSEGKPVVLISPPKPEVIYVPKYDPVAVYAPPPPTVPPPTQTVVVEEKSSTDALVVGLLCFTAGVLIADAAHDNYYGYPPHYGYGGIYYGGRPYYPPPPYMYRPPYGGGYYPAHGYHPPPNYNHNFNNNTIIINQGDNNYWNNDFGGGGRGDAGRAKSGSGRLESPITKANPNRPELNQLNKEGQERTRKAAEQPRASTRDAAGAKPGTRDAAAAKTPTAKPAVKGSYAGTEKARSQNVASAKATTGDRATTAAAKPAAGTKPATGTKSAAAARPTPSTAKAPVDRGYAGKSTGAATKAPSTAAARPTPSASQPTASASRPQATTPKARPEMSKPAPSSSGGGGSAFSGSGSGSSERAASQRGRASSASSGTRASSSSGASRTGGRSR